MKFRTLYASDLHLRDRRGDEQFALKQIVDGAIQNKVGQVVLAGDLLDRQTNRAKAIAYFFRQIDRLEDENIDVWFTQGQHDADDPPWLLGHRHAKHMHKQLVEAGPFVMYGLDWQPYGKLQEALAELPEAADFLVAHQVWGNWMGDIAAPQGEFREVPEQVLRLYTGDLHQRRLETHKNAGGVKMTVCSTGAVCKQKIDEPDDHYYALMGDDGVFKFRKLVSRVHVESDLLLRTEDLDKFVAELEATLAAAYQKGAAADAPPEVLKPTMRVKFSGKLADCARRVEKAVGDKAHLSFLEVPPEEKASAVAAAKKAKGEAVTPLSVLREEVNPDESPEVYELVERVLGAQDQAAEFAKWRQEQLEG
jgi:hypothetical protein